MIARRAFSNGTLVALLVALSGPLLGCGDGKGILPFDLGLPVPDANAPELPPVLDPAPDVGGELDQGGGDPGLDAPGPDADGAMTPSCSLGAGSCNACIEGACCAQYQACEQASCDGCDPSSAACDERLALVGCFASSCFDDCWPSCDIFYDSGERCGQCVNSSCCDVQRTCAEDETCLRCITSGSRDQTCTQNAKLRAVGQCFVDSCSDACCAAAGEACDRTADCCSGNTCQAGVCRPVCQPDCAGKACGDDGCGGSCGTCDGNATCGSDGTCIPCTPDCTGRACGDDGCGGSCGTCGGTDACQQGVCVPCAPDCAGRQCGDDGCGGSCGSCDPFDTCSAGGTCLACAPACSGRQCGPDSCGGSCGTCSGSNSACDGAGQCVCVPACAGKECGPDGCGRNCGTCASPETCGGGDVPFQCGRPLICTSGGWCWDNPYPQGFDLLGAWGIDGGSDWLVGAKGTVLYSSAAGWRGWALLRPENLISVWGASDTDVWVVGEGGLLMHWDGSTWTTPPSPTTRTLRFIWGTSASDIWAGGDAGTVIHFDGSNWTTVTVPGLTSTNHLQAVWGFSSTDIWVVGSGVFLHWNGSTWTPTTTVATGASPGQLTGVWGPLPNDIWAVGPAGRFRYDGNLWRSAGTGATQVIGKSGTDLFISTNVSMEGTGYSTPINALRLSGNSFLAVGNLGLIYRRPIGGTNWVRETKGLVDKNPYDVFMRTIEVSDPLVYTGGSDAGPRPLLHSRSPSGAYSRLTPNNTTGTFSQVTAFSATDLWGFVGEGHNLDHLSGSTWALTPTGFNSNAVKVFSGTNIWAVGGNSIRRWDGGQWATVSHPLTGTSVDFMAIDGQPNDLWVGGTQGALLHWNGSTFSSVVAGIGTSSITTLSAPSTSFVLAGGSFGVVRWNGSSWSPGGLTGSILNLWARGQTEAWANVQNGGLRRWDGTTWSAVPGTLLAGPMKGGADGALWVAGQGGEVVVLRP